MKYQKDIINMRSSVYPKEKIEKEDTVQEDISN
jgi:hypothetical protein